MLFELRGRVELLDGWEIAQSFDGRSYPKDCQAASDCETRYQCHFFYGSVAIPGDDN
jgi:hypothetical protein